MKGSDEILGGYNPIEWKSLRIINPGSRYGKTQKSFIFSFKDKDSTVNYILSRVKNEDNAIYHWSGHSPSFGCGDLVLFGDTGTGSIRKTGYYEKPIRELKLKNFLW